MEADISLIAYGILVGILAGGLSGTLAGLAGLGGGLIYVPVFLLTMPQSGSDNVALYVMASLMA
ncbi:MAG: hypothetical protein R8K22_06715, partial [Mariprofundaceae bacterium]